MRFFLAMVVCAILIGVAVPESVLAQDEKIKGKARVQEIQKIEDIKEKDGIIYFGRPDCPECNRFEKSLFKALDAYDIKVSYFDTNKFRETPNFQQMLGKLKVTSVPALITVDKGKLVGEMHYRKNLEDKEIDNLLSGFIVGYKNERLVDKLFLVISIFSSTIVLLILAYIAYHALRSKIELRGGGLIFISCICICFCAYGFYRYGIYIDYTNRSGTTVFANLCVLNVVATIGSAILLVRQKRIGRG